MSLRAGGTRASKLSEDINRTGAEQRIIPSQANLETTGSGVYPLRRLPIDVNPRTLYAAIKCTPRNAGLAM
jgi:hypothetical protein